MIQHLRQLFADELASAASGVLSCGACAALVRYRASGVELECLLPRWSELSYQLERCGEVMLIVALRADGSRWLAYQGCATLLDIPAWSPSTVRTKLAQPAELYLMVRLTPRRIDLIDERQSWGITETFELPVASSK